MKRLLLIVVATLLAVALLAVPGTAVAGTVPLEYTVPRGLHGAGPLIRSTSQNVRNPWGCFFRADNPHRSTHGPYDINAQGWNICTGPGVPPNAGVEASLYRQDCWWVFCKWTVVSNSSTNHPPTNFSGSPPSIHTNVTYNCNGTSTHTYKLDVYAWAEDSSGYLACG